MSSNNPLENLSREELMQILASRLSLDNAPQQLRASVSAGVEHTGFGNSISTSGAGHSSSHGPAGGIHQQTDATNPGPVVNPSPMHISLPITQPYHSVRGGLGGAFSHNPPTMGTPPSAGPSMIPLGLGHPSATQLPGYGSLTPAQYVNQQRLASSSSTQPRGPTRTTRGTRRRGPSIQPPALGRGSRPDPLAACKTTVFGADGTVPHAALQVCVKVYPPTDKPQHQLLVYRELRGSFTEALEKQGLLYKRTFPCSTTISGLITDVVSLMEISEHAYQFTTLAGSHIIAAEALPLQLLMFRNQGKARLGNGTVHLCVAPFPLAATLAEIIDPRGPYYKRIINDSVIEGDYLVFHLACRIEPVIFHTLDASGRRAHRCLSSRIYARFPSDRVSRGHLEELVTSGGEDAPDSDAEGDPGFYTSTPPPRTPATTVPNSPTSRPWSPLQLDSIPAHPPPTQATRPTAAQPAHPQVLQATASIVTLHTLPGSIWDRQWSPETPPRTMQQLSISALPAVVYQHAHLTPGGSLARSTLPKLVISGGPDVAGLASAFRDRVSTCCDLGDFTEILSPNRTFRIVHTGVGEIAGPESNSTLSLGSGVEREVLQLAFQHFRDAGARWFTPRMDGYHTIAVSQTLASARYITPQRLRELRCLGALTALLLINCMPPTPLDPLLLHFLIYDCDLHAVRPALCAEWHPDLRALIDSWLSIGPQGDVAPFQAHFSSYHERELACLYDRDASAHKALAAEMLYVSIVGNAPPEHPELQAFRDGLRLPCRNGFTFCDVPKAFTGGPVMFWSLIWNMHISSFTALEDHLDIKAPSTGMCAALSSAFGGGMQASPRDLLLDFLRGDGVPDASALESVRDGFTPVVLPQLAFADQPGFRARMFAWAATGTTSLAPGEKIKVEFITATNIEYGPDPSAAETMAAQGKFSIRTCFRQVLIPYGYLLGLVQSSDSHATAQVRIYNWFLLEVLNAIGGHSML